MVTQSIDTYSLISSTLSPRTHILYTVITFRRITTEWNTTKTDKNTKSFNIKSCKHRWRGGIHSTLKHQTETNACFCVYFRTRDQEEILGHSKPLVSVQVTVFSPWCVDTEIGELWEAVMRILDNYWQPSLTLRILTLLFNKEQWTLVVNFSFPSSSFSQQCCF